ncbi:MAG: hypothetical protein GF411_18900 [Candidatus Lokiarchaeota archaeon]|nr:hypothetical protein [Candidatus Lokiarchaeota archaeon]
MSTTDIARMYNVGGHVVRRLLRSNGLKPSGKPSQNVIPHNKHSVDIDQIKELHESGMCLSDIASVLGQGVHVIKNRMKKIGLKPHAPQFDKPTNLKSVIGDNAFDKLNDVDWLKNEYIKSGRSTRDIASEIGCGKKAVSSAVKRFGLKVHDIRITREEFVAKAKEIHGDTYDYGEMIYESYDSLANMKCPTHGMFWQVPRYHILNRNGCQLCSGGHLQNEVYEFVNELSRSKMNDRSAIYPYELDILVLDCNLAIEVNGIYWHSYDHVETTQERQRHVFKLDRCNELGIRLIQISEDEWRNNQHVVKSIIKSKLNMTDRIYARKCDIMEVGIGTYRKFMASNHLQGYKYSHFICGLYYNDELLAVMSFNKHNKYGWEITRFANKIGKTVIGGASRLFKHFIKRCNPELVLSYANRRYSNGDLYYHLGFDLDGITRPNYCYVKQNRVYSRIQFQKHKLKDKLEHFDEHVTEAENMFLNGYRRLWDAGNLRFIWTR